MAEHLTTYKPIPSIPSYNIPSLCSFILSHPLYFSYFIFFSPYLFRFFFFISPLFFTTSLLLLLSLIASTLPHSKLGFVQSMVDTLRSKLNNVDVDDEYRDFEDLELYKIVFHGPPLLTAGDPDDNDKHVLMIQNQDTVTVTESEEQRSLERLFEELDRFEASTEPIKMKKNETRSQIEEAVEELQKLEPVTSPISDEDQQTDENSFSVNSNPSRTQSSSSFGSFESIGDETTSFEMKQNKTTMFEMKENETRSHVEKVIGELQKSNSTAAIEPIEVSNNYKTTSHVRKVLQKLEPPVTSSISGEDQKTVRSNSTAAIDVKANETTSHARKVFQKLETVTSSASGEDNKTVRSNSTVEIEMKDNKTTSHVKKMLQKLEPPVTSSISSEDKKSVQNSFSRSNSWRLDSSSSFGSYGSMRKEKEWKRTLACKLFEERNSSQRGEEGMDSLWEAYEDDNASRKSRNQKERNEKKVMVKNKKGEFKCFEDVGDDDEDDEDEEFMSNGQLCCLKALKLSTGKMNFGMGKPNLVKISKAIKGFGWLHHVGSKSKKNY